MNRQQTNTAVCGKPRTHYNRNQGYLLPPGGKPLYNVSGHTPTKMYSGSYRHPKFGYAARNGVVYPRGREGQVYIHPTIRGNSHSLSRHPTGFNESDQNKSNMPMINTGSSSTDVRTSPVHSSRSPNHGKPISGVRSPGDTFTNEPNLEEEYVKLLEMEDVKLLEMEDHMRKVTVPRPHSETISQGLLPYHIRETLERLLATFKMTGPCAEGQYKSPDGWTDVNVDPEGNMEFLITNRERYDIGIPLLMGTLTRVHQMCMLMRIRDQRALSTDKPNAIDSRCMYVDPFEVSWAIQIHLFKMHKMGVRCVVMGMNNILFIDKNILLFMVRDSLTRTYMSKENAYWAFKTIATVIANEW